MMILQDPLDLRYAEYNWGSQLDLAPLNHILHSVHHLKHQAANDQPGGEQPSYSGVNLKCVSSEEDEDHIF